MPMCHYTHSHHTTALCSNLKTIGGDGDGWRSQLADARAFAAYKCACYYRHAPSASFHIHDDNNIDLLAPVIHDTLTKDTRRYNDKIWQPQDTENEYSTKSHYMHTTDGTLPSTKAIDTMKWYRGVALLEWILDYVPDQPSIGYHSSHMALSLLAEMHHHSSYWRHGYSSLMTSVMVTCNAMIYQQPSPMSTHYEYLMANLSANTIFQHLENINAVYGRFLDRKCVSLPNNSLVADHDTKNITVDYTIDNIALEQQRSWLHLGKVICEDIVQSLDQCDEGRPATIGWCCDDLFDPYAHMYKIKQHHGTKRWSHERHKYAIFKQILQYRRDHLHDTRSPFTLANTSMN
jgi:hypothetical protein